MVVRDFAASVEFWTTVLRELVGVEPVKVIPQAEYANWDIGGEAALAVFGRARLVEVVGSEDVPGPAMLVLRVGDVDRAAEVFVAAGGRVVVEPTDRPDWGVRAAHLRDPEGNLVELQAY
ncbi:glyoxalase [Nocardia sp. NRRL S-836]|nr:glyoxalase [Nocardia sp. NRRL S-836]